MLTVFLTVTIADAVDGWCRLCKNALKFRWPMIVLILQYGKIQIAGTTNA